MPTLYYVDDERLFLKQVGNALKDRAEYKPYCGAGASNDFFNTLLKKDSNIVTDDSFYLLDGRMSVPTALERDKEVWQEFEGSRSDVCGFAMASYLITNYNVNKNRIKIFSAYLDVIEDYAQDFDLDEDMFLDKHRFNSNLLEKWLPKTKTKA